MKIIEEFVRIMKEDINERGCVDHSSIYAVKLDKDGLIKSIEFGSIPSEKYLATCDPKEREIILEWLAFKIRTMKEWEGLYNKSVMAYNDYCGKRAGEDDNMFNLVVKGCNIANVLPFKKNQKLKETKEKRL